MYDEEGDEHPGPPGPEMTPDVNDIRWTVDRLPARDRPAQDGIVECRSREQGGYAFQWDFLNVADRDRSLLKDGFEFVDGSIAHGPFLQSHSVARRFSPMSSGTQGGSVESPRGEGQSIVRAVRRCNSECRTWSSE